MIVGVCARFTMVRRQKRGKKSEEACEDTRNRRRRGGEALNCSRMMIYDR